MLRSIKVDGEIRKIPTGVHIDGMIYYNKKVAEQAGVDPTKWASLDDMFADMEKVQKAGFTFIGVGGNTFQAGYLFHALVAAVAGPDIYNRFYGEIPDKTVFDEKGLRDAIDMFRKITSQADAGWVNRQWNETTNTVISGKTLMQIHGDWMKGQWKANKKVLGEDFGCINIPGTKALAVTVDAFGILGGVPDDVLKAELDFAGIVVDPKINAEFASIKGSSPVRLDVPTDKLDACNELVLDFAEKARLQRPEPVQHIRHRLAQLGLEHDVHVPGRPEHDGRRRHRGFPQRIRSRLPVRPGAAGRMQRSNGGEVAIRPGERGCRQQPPRLRRCRAPPRACPRCAPRGSTRTATRRQACRSPS